nr:MAG TPA: hypothetical protein [Caudoviricetes sp.]
MMIPVCKSSVFLPRRSTSPSTGDKEMFTKNFRQ